LHGQPNSYITRERKRDTQHANGNETTAGFITRNEIEAESETIIELYGKEFYEACLAAPEGSTFLGLRMSFGHFDAK